VNRDARLIGNPKPTQSPDECGMAAFVMAGRLARIGNQSILFGPSQQALFALNDMGADIWRCLEDGLSPEAISSEIASRGINRHQAVEYVDTAVRQWERLGLIRLSPAWFATSSLDQVSQLVAVPGAHVRIVYPGAHAFPAASVFRHLEIGGAVADVVLELVEHGQRIHLFRDRRWILSCSPDELAVVVKGQLLTEVLERSTYELAVHAAALLQDDRILLLCGSPGAGKTTLALGLVRAGFGFAGDDVTLLDSLGHGVGIPFAPAVKVGAWPILADYYPDLDAAPVCRRPDRRRVRYLAPKEFVSPSPRKVGWVVLLRRRADASAELAPVDPVDALRGLLNGSFALGGELTGTAFDLLTEIIRSADVFCLTYSRLPDAIALLQKACR
jgi:coenzyme PQQ synthesis protein D (PqqD)